MEHQVLKTAQNAQELVTINKGLLRAQVHQASAATSTSSRLVTAVSLSQAQLQGIRDEVAAVARVLDQSVAASLASQAALDHSIRSGFSAMHNDLQVVAAVIAKVAENQDREMQVLEQVSATLSRPYETKYKELLRKADTLLKHAVRKADQNQANNLEDAFKLFSQVVTNPIGEYDHYAWFELGWLNWRSKGDLAAARDAFGRAERYSDAAGDTTFRVDSLRHLAHIEFLQHNPALAAQTISHAINADPDNAALFYESALYTALTGNTEDAGRRLHRSLEIDPMLFDRLLDDDEFQKAPNWSALIDGEWNRQRELTERSLGRLRTLIQAIEPYSECSGASGYLSEVEQRLHGSGYLTLRQYEIGARELYQKLIDGARDQLSVEIAKNDKGIAETAATEKTLRKMEMPCAFDDYKQQGKDKPKAWRPLVFEIIAAWLNIVREEGLGPAILPLFIGAWFVLMIFAVTWTSVGYLLKELLIESGHVHEYWEFQDALQIVALVFAVLIWEIPFAIRFIVQKSRAEKELAHSYARMVENIDSANAATASELAKLAEVSDEFKQKREKHTRWLSELSGLDTL